MSLAIRFLLRKTDTYLHSMDKASPLMLPAEGAGKISYIAEFDTTRSLKFVNRAIEEILNSDLDDLPKQKTIAFPK